MKWFRFYSEALHDPKVQRLNGNDFKAWVNLLCLANETEPRGSLPNDADVGFALRVPQQKAGELLARFVEWNLLDLDNDLRRCVVHQWNKWQPASDNAAERIANKRRTSSEHVQPDAEQVRSREEEEKNRTEKKKKEIREEETKRNIFVLYDRYMGKPSITPTMRELLIEAEDEYPADCIEHCFERAAASSDGRRSWSYVESILKRHQREGCDERNANGANRGEPSAGGNTESVAAHVQRLVDEQSRLIGVRSSRE